jgi:hypothetical protein
MASFLRPGEAEGFGYLGGERPGAAGQPGQCHGLAGDLIRDM